MSDSGQFCPNCGDPITAQRAPPVHTGPSSGPQTREDTLCDACYLARFDLVDAPDRVTVDVCATCGAVKRGNQWEDIGAQDYTDIAIDAVQDALGVHIAAENVSWGIDPEQVDPTTIRMTATFTGVIRDTPVEESVTIPVKIARGSCTRCGRIAGDYYAGVVQVRATDRQPRREETQRATTIAESVVAEMQETGDRNAFLTNISDVDGGLDIKVSTTKIGEQIARRLVTEFGGQYSTSETLVTQDENGDEVYRVTYAVRLPPYTPGEIIEPNDDDGPVLVRSVTGNLKGTRLASGDAYEAPASDANAATADRLGRIDEAVETTLVAIEDDHAVQILDPETYTATTVPRPDYLDPEADTVLVFKSRAGLHIVPETEA